MNGNKKLITLFTIFVFKKQFRSQKLQKLYKMRTFSIEKRSEIIGAVKFGTTIKQIAMPKRYLIFAEIKL